MACNDPFQTHTKLPWHYCIKRCSFSVALVWSLTLVASNCLAFKLKTEATTTEHQVLNLASTWTALGFFDRSTEVAVNSFLNETVHESITHRIWGCEAAPDSEQCFAAKDAPVDLIVGIRWNDNPPFQISDSRYPPHCQDVTIRIPALRADCWLKIFRDGHKGSRNGIFYNGESKSALLLRSHFGDMQFLHSMANEEKEKASATRERIIAWAQLAYQVANNEISAGSYLWNIPIGEFSSLFNRQRYWTAALLFGMGDPKYQKSPGLNQVAFGSLLHMIQDSFARGHVLRRPTAGATCNLPDNSVVPAPGLIAEFRSYARQDNGDHSREDGKAALKAHLLTNSPNVVDIGKSLRAMFEQKKLWKEVRPYIECIFQLEDPDALATSKV